jgi:hypothetical protein
MIVQVVRTPFDLERTLEAQLCRVNHWTDTQARPETAMIEHILGQAFSEGAWRDPGLSLDSLDSIAEPLGRLNASGLQLVAVVSRGLYTLPSRGDALREIGFEMVDYLVAPDPCYFRPADAPFDAPIHRLGSGCVAGHAAIVCERAPSRREKSFRIWTSPESVLRDFEWTVPWCAGCRADEGRAVA